MMDQTITPVPAPKASKIAAGQGFLRVFSVAYLGLLDLVLADDLVPPRQTETPTDWRATIGETKLDYFLRRLNASKPTKPIPTSVKVPGSGIMAIARPTAVNPFCVGPISVHTPLSTSTVPR